MLFGTRFNKANLIATIEHRMQTLEDGHSFKMGDGWAVVDGKDTEIIVAFGQYSALRSLREDILS